MTDSVALAASRQSLKVNSGNTTTTNVIDRIIKSVKSSGNYFGTKRCDRICFVLLGVFIAANSMKMTACEKSLLLTYSDSIKIGYDTVTIRSNYTEIGRSDDDEDGWSDVKFAIYMTTHLTETHLSFLPCWYHAVRHMRIFRYADLILYISTEPPPEVLDQLPFRNVVVKRYENRGYHEGAIQAMVDPFVNETDQWFEEYDWVIRVNPDVLIRNDTWLIQTMLDNSIDAIVLDCHNRKPFPPEAVYDHNDRYIHLVEFHSDFTAFRPRAIDRDLLFVASNYSVAENHISVAMRNIYNSSRFVYIDGGVVWKKGHCRVAGIHSPVVHAHDMNQFCPEYYSATDGYSY